MLVADERSNMGLKGSFPEAARRQRWRRGWDLNPR